jgi:hypothetical protein
MKDKKERFPLPLPRGLRIRQRIDLEGNKVALNWRSGMGQEPDFYGEGDVLKEFDKAVKEMRSNIDKQVSDFRERLTIKLKKQTDEKGKG